MFWLADKGEGGAREKMFWVETSSGWSSSPSDRNQTINSPHVEHIDILSTYR